MRGRLGHNGGVDAAPTSDQGTLSSWSDTGQVEEYLDRIERLPPRAAGEDVLRTVLPAAPHCPARPRMWRRAPRRTGPRDPPRSAPGGGRGQFAGHVGTGPPRLCRGCPGDGREWDLARSIEPLGRFDVIVSGFAIHHLEDERKQGLFAEVAQILDPGGLFANLEVVASATPELHAEFLGLIGRQEDDPEDRLAGVEPQLQWMRAAGLDQVECLWRWRGFALLVGRSPLPTLSGPGGSGAPCP